MPWEGPHSEQDLRGPSCKVHLTMQSCWDPSDCNFCHWGHYSQFNYVFHGHTCEWMTFLEKESTWKPKQFFWRASFTPCCIERVEDIAEVKFGDRITFHDSAKWGLDFLVSWMLNFSIHGALALFRLHRQRTRSRKTLLTYEQLFLLCWQVC